MAGTTTYQAFSFYRIIYQHRFDSHDWFRQSSRLRSFALGPHPNAIRCFQACLLDFIRFHSVNQRARRSVHHEPLSGSRFFSVFISSFFSSISPFCSWTHRRSLLYSYICESISIVGMCCVQSV